MKEVNSTSTFKVIVATHFLPFQPVLEGLGGLFLQQTGGTFSEECYSSPDDSCDRSLSESSFNSKDFFEQNRATTKGLKRSTEDQIKALGSNFQFHARAGNSALFSGLSSLTGQHKVVYVGWHGPLLAADDFPIDGRIKLSEEQQANLKAKYLAEKSCIPGTYNKCYIPPIFSSLSHSILVFLSNEDIRGHYDGYCKSNLWPLFHYILWDQVTDGREDVKNWNHYHNVNAAFAQTIAEVYEPGDLVWIHDYHLLLTPQLLRKKQPDATIGFFLHSPFPSSEIFRCLPSKNARIDSAH